MYVTGLRFRRRKSIASNSVAYVSAYVLRGNVGSPVSQCRATNLENGSQAYALLAGISMQLFVRLCLTVRQMNFARERTHALKSL